MFLESLRRLRYESTAVERRSDLVQQSDEEDVHQLCLESFSAQLACKPHTLQLQRLRLIYCLDSWGFCESVVSQGFKVLEKPRPSPSGEALQVVLAECKLKAKIVDICEKGDAFIKDGNDFPGGAESFELLSRFCYNNCEWTVMP
ncbi:unnamed protein product [Eruca vesicaria subsp. sativa]|uniref:Separase-like TPR repeats region domain-containing protein n=1 Tax=Eruca vesicaria subsp. sativa TaxID=29727 RepID=A0ABC8IN14_ERUVS|nr:unnamed protein product [Eruca vesicaria subsp. sativa]